MKTQGYSVKLEVLTPVHVGSGDMVNALGYLREGDTLHVVDSDRWSVWLEGQKAAQKFVGWMERLLQISDSQQQRQFSLTRFLTDELKRSDIGAVAGAVECYSLKLEGRREPDPLRGFRAHLRDAQGRAYLPGSSLKGAIRTALIEDLLQEDDQMETVLIKPLQKISHTDDRRALRRNLRDVWEKMEQRLLRGGQRKANFDLLRFVLVSDSQPFPHEQVSVCWVRSEGTQKTTDTWIEALRPGASTQFTLSLVPDAPLNQLGLQEELREYLLWEALMEVLHERAQRRLQRELQYPYPPAVRSCLQELQQMNQPDAPLLCVGWGQGYLGTTVMGLLQDANARQYATLIEKMRPALPRQGQGVQPNRFPKTRRAVRNQQAEAVYPLGWVRLQVG
ncbi:MAG: type III-A CRISPR-associated RAMP protein Csm5 [Armatimonadota bacterium]|nr:type III-A CRISPR-associated RAMP protein Csm5 [Armatimonadota bacterium]